MTNQNNIKSFNLNNCSFLTLSEVISTSVSHHILSIDNNINNIRDHQSSVSFPYISRVEDNKFQCLFTLNNHLHNIVVSFNNNSFNVDYCYLDYDVANKINNIIKSKL